MANVVVVKVSVLFFLGGGGERGRCGPTQAMASSFMSFLDHTPGRTTLGRTPLDEWSGSR